MPKIDGQEVTLKPIFPGNAHLVWVYLERFDASENTHVPWDDASSVTVALCTDRQGDTVIASCGPFSLAAVDATNHPGYYFYVIPASVTALLDNDTYRGRTIYQRTTAGAAAELKIMQPLVVTEPRFAA